MIKTKGTLRSKKSSGRTVKKANITGRSTAGSKRGKSRIFVDTSTTLDSKNRVTLGKKVIEQIKEITHAENISSFKVHLTKDGDVVLKAMSAIPANEMWLWKNKKAAKMVLAGLDDAKKGRLVKAPEDYSEYIDD